MKFAAFFRNLNLGRANCPNRAQFEQAFLAAGAMSASSFLTNGTLVFEVATAACARNLCAGARERLHAACGLVEPVFVRRVDRLAAVVATDPFAAIDRAGVYECCVSFLPARCRFPAELPAMSRRGDVRILHRTASEVFSVSLKLGQSPGSPNAFLEKQLGRPTTTRAWNTVVRLVRRHR